MKAILFALAGLINKWACCHKWGDPDVTTLVAPDGKSNTGHIKVFTCSGCGKMTGLRSDQYGIKSYKIE